VWAVSEVDAYQHRGTAVPDGVARTLRKAPSETGLPIPVACQSQKTGELVPCTMLSRWLRELEQQADASARFHEVGGDQIVEVGKYAYRCQGDVPLEVGTTYCDQGTGSVGSRTAQAHRSVS
jgi:hypothetical protein